MRFLQNLIVVAIVVLGTTSAWGQYGLYGSPEVLQLPLANPAIMPGPYAAQPTVAYATPATTYVMPSLQTAYTPNQGAVPATPAPPTPPGGPVMPVPPGNAAAQPADAPGPLTRAVDCFEKAVCGGGGCAPAACCPWYGSTYALFLGRNAANRLWITAQNEINLQHTDTGTNWSWGGEIRFGRRFCCDRWALEATYWTLESFSGASAIRDPAGLITPLDFSLATRAVTFGGLAFPATNWFDGALEHRVSRRSEIHSVELDLIRNRVFTTSELPWDVDWSAGLRFFHFNDDLTFASLRGGGDWAVPADAAYLNDEVANNLFGFQVGFDANYYLHPAVRFFFAPKLGIYNNAINHDFRLFLGDGTNADVRDPGTGAVLDTFPVHSSTNTVSFLTEIDLGLDWRFSERWSARAGYRVVVVTGVGLADNQIPPFITDIHEISDIDTNGELILHGAFFGLTYNF